MYSVSRASNTTVMSGLVSLGLVALAIVTRDACLAINDKLGIPNPSAEPPRDPNFAFSAAGYFNGGNSGASGGYAAVSPY